MILIREPYDEISAKARERIALNLLCQTSLQVFMAYLLVCLLLILATRIFPISMYWQQFCGLLLIAGLLVGARVWRNWPSLEVAAATLDNRALTYEAISTARENWANTSEMLTSQRLRANAIAKDLNIGKLFPIQVSSLMLTVTILTAGLCLLLLALPNPNLARTRQAQFEKQSRSIAAADIAKIAQQAKSNTNDQTAVRSNALQNELAKAMAAVTKAPDQESAISSLSAAQDRINNLADPQTASKEQEAISAGKALEKNSSTSPIGDAIRQGDYSKASDLLRKLNADSASRTGEQNKAIAQALEQASLASPNSALSTDLHNASTAMSKQDAKAAQDALNKASSELSQLNKDLNYKGDLAQSSNSLQDVKQNLEKTGSTQKQTPNQQSSNSQPNAQGAAKTGVPNPAQRSNTGTASDPNGTGNGTQASDKSGNGHGNGAGKTSGVSGSTSETIYIPSANPNPTGSQQGNGPAQNQTYDGTLTPYTDVLRDYQNGAFSQIDRQLIPVQRRDLVHQYFVDLGS